MSNTIKFTDSGGRVWAHALRDRDRIEITVSDTGCGISPEFLPHVFDRFSQADSSSTRKKGGLELGLALVRHLAELHGGTVEAASEGPGVAQHLRYVFPQIFCPRPSLQHLSCERFTAKFWPV